MKKIIKIIISLFLSFVCVFSIGDFIKLYIVEVEIVYLFIDLKLINEIFFDLKFV